MAIDMRKGEKISLEKDVLKYRIGLGWDVNDAANGQAFDLDANAIILDASGKALGGKICYFNNLDPLNGAVVHSGDNLTGAGDGDDELISVDLSKLPEEATEIIFNVDIYQAKARGQNFGQVKNAVAHLYEDESTDAKLTFDLSEDASTGNILKFVRLYKHNDAWKFAAVGETFEKTFNEYISEFGL